VIHRFVGLWVLRRAFRLLTVDDPRPLRERLTREAKRILIGAGITAAVLLVALIALVAISIALVT
jgi:hypothetical protein